MSRWLPLLILVACIDAPKGLGVECSRTSQCDTPLVCRLQACRNECASSRDCPSGSACLVDSNGLGACRLVDEDCSSCPEPTTCVFGECLNSCASDTDCVLGQCLNEIGEACIDTRCACLENDDCEDCRPECISDRDCRFGATCESGACVPPSTIDASGDAGVDGIASDSGIDLLPNVSSVAAGNTFTCAISEGETYCWGDFEWDSTESTFRPTRMGLVADTLVAGPTRVCAIREGALTCLGQNLNGELGDGTRLVSDTGVVPEGMGSNVEDVALGDTHTCALRAGSVWCWGRGSFGALGTGSEDESLVPVEIGLTDIVDVAAGDSQSCAVTSAGGLWCWGFNQSGRAALGDMPLATTPTNVDIPFAAVAVELGGPHGCAVADDQRLFCWGVTAVHASNVPTEISGVLVQQVAIASHVCARTTADEAQCWGVNNVGQIGTGGSFVPTPPPGSPVALSGVDEVTAAGSHSCARTAEQLWCWGWNEDAQLGAGHRGTVGFPVPVLAP